MTLPTGWTEANLLDIVRLHDGKRVPLNQAERAAKPGPYPYFGANGKVDTVGDYLFDGNFVLLAEDGGYFDDPKRGVAYEVSGKFWVNNHAHILEAEGNIPNGYLCRLLNSIDWLPFVSGTTRLKLTQGGMQRVRLPIPPLPEQQRIVAKLDAMRVRLARARADLARVRPLAARLREATLAEAFSHEHISHWPTSTFEQVIGDALIGLVRSKGEQLSRGTPYIRMNHFDLNGRWNDDALTFVDVSANELQRYELRPGDILFNTRNSSELVGKVAIWPKSQPGFVFNNNLLRLRFVGQLDPDFVFRYMMSPIFRAIMEREKSATTSVAAVYQRSLYRFPLPVPPLELQRTIVARISAAFAHAAVLESEANRAQMLLDRFESTVFTRAFRGELVPQDPGDEPASVLLGRIRTQRAARGKPSRRSSGRA